MFEPVAESGVLDEVGRIGQPRLARSMVLDLEPAGAGDVMHVIAANFGVRLTVTVVQRE